MPKDGTLNAYLTHEKGDSGEISLLEFHNRLMIQDPRKMYLIFLDKKKELKEAQGRFSEMVGGASGNSLAMLVEWLSSLSYSNRVKNFLPKPLSKMPFCYIPSSSLSMDGIKPCPQVIVVIAISLNLFLGEFSLIVASADRPLVDTGSKPEPEGGTWRERTI